MNAAFTAGPWRINKYRSVGAGELGTEPIVAQIEPFYGRDRRFGDDQANARLIAAAPELYEALATARQAVADDLAVDLDCACLADADGKPDRATADADMLDFIESKEAVLAKIDAALAKARGEP